MIGKAKEQRKTGDKSSMVLDANDNVELESDRYYNHIIIT